MEKPDLVDRVCDLLSYRFDQYVDRWQVIATLVIAVCILALSLGLYIRGRVTSTPKVIQAAPSAAIAPQADKKDSSLMYVYVCGAVNKPGVYRVGSGTRINAAVALAGGLTADADAAPINLAKKLTDGERIYIPRVNERPSPNNTVGASGPVNASGSGGPSGDTANGANVGGSFTGLNGEQLTSAWNVDGKLNLNTATADDLDKLPGIGPAFIARIMDYRQKHEGFTDIAQLRNIEGIGPKTFAKLKPLVFVE
jgi:competence protein ComEA